MISNICLCGQYHKADVQTCPTCGSHIPPTHRERESHSKALAQLELRAAISQLHPEIDPQELQDFIGQSKAKRIIDADRGGLCRDQGDLYLESMEV